MTLNSVIFIFGMLPLLAVLYYALPPFFRGHAPLARKVVLLLASLVFFAWVARQYLPFLLIIVVLNWGIARCMGKRRGTGAAKALLALGIVADVLALVYYKYFDFLGTQFAALLNLEYTMSGIMQPLGISFLTFSLISYLVDVYRKTVDADKSLVNVALWATFFPKLTSGPISRYADMYSEENKERAGRFNVDDVAYGARRFVIGLGKKVVIADVLGMTVDYIFADQLTGIDTPTAWLGIICYTLQIFFDFAGYSDMALGLAAIFGYRLKENFDYPYVSKTIGEFWHRWHISLSTWLRDYIYFPLGGSRRGNVYFNLLVVFVVSGIWHGASWHFVFWGLWYAVFMFADRIYRRHADKLRVPSPVLWLCTMLVVVLGWVLFRAEDMSQAVSYLQLLFGIGSVDTQFYTFWYYFDHRVMFLIAVGAVLSTPIFARARERFEGTAWWEAVRLVGVPLLFAISLLFVVNSTYSPFLYAQF